MLSRSRPWDVGQSHAKVEGKELLQGDKVCEALLSHPSLPPPPLFEPSLLSSGRGCVSLLCGGGRCRRTGDIKRYAHTADSQEGHLNELR